MVVKASPKQNNVPFISLLDPIQEGMKTYQSPNLVIQIWDNNHFGPGDYLGEEYRIGLKIGQNNGISVLNFIQ